MLNAEELIAQKNFIDKKLTLTKTYKPGNLYIYIPFSVTLQQYADGYKIYMNNLVCIRKYMCKNHLYKGDCLVEFYSITENKIIVLPGKNRCVYRLK